MDLRGLLHRVVERVLVAVAAASAGKGEGRGGGRKRRKGFVEGSGRIIAARSRKLGTPEQTLHKDRERRRRTRRSLRGLGPVGNIT
jgi:hypothetical protein